MSWDPSSPDPTDYRVNWAKSSEEYPSWTSDDGNLYPTATSVDLTGLDPGIEYKIRVRARYWDGDDADSPWSGPSAEITAQVTLPLPQTPNIMGTLVSPEGEVTLMLQDPSDDSITGYQYPNRSQARLLLLRGRYGFEEGQQFFPAARRPGSQDARDRIFLRRPHHLVWEDGGLTASSYPIALWKMRPHSG